MRKKVLFKKATIVVIIGLILIINLSSSTGKLTLNVINEENICDTYSNSLIKNRSCEHYAYTSTGDGLNKFILNDPGNLTLICNGGFLSMGTWTNDNYIITCEWYSGALYKIDPETCEIIEIGGGGTGLNGITMDPTTGMLYGVSSDGSIGGLWLIDPETGDQEYIGDFVSTAWIVGIASDSEGTLYGWDITPDYLYEIDKETGEAMAIGPLGFNLNYRTDGHFCMGCDILYLVAYTTSPYDGCFLYECNEDTGSCTLIGPFEENASAGFVAIPYNLSLNPPVTTISFDPPEPDGCNGYYVSNVTVELNATDDSEVNATYYRKNSGEWQIYEIPFVLYEDGNDILIEFYSTDDEGNIENIKSEIIDIDKTPPEGIVEWETEKIDGKWYVTFIVNVTDETSGLDGSVDIYINDCLIEIIEGPGPVYSYVIQWSKQFKTAKVGFQICDRACNCVLLEVNGSGIKSFNINQEQKSIYLCQQHWFLRNQIKIETPLLFK